MGPVQPAKTTAMGGGGGQVHSGAAGEQVHSGGGGAQVHSGRIHRILWEGAVLMGWKLILQSSTYTTE